MFTSYLRLNLVMTHFLLMIKRFYGYFQIKGNLKTLHYSLEITFELDSKFKVVERGSSLEKRGIQECREGLGALECPVFLSLRRV
jgi:hypothetical protein